FSQLFAHLKGLRRHAGTGVLKPQRRVGLHERRKGLHGRFEQRQLSAMLSIPLAPAALTRPFLALSMPLPGMHEVRPSDFITSDGHKIAGNQIEQDCRTPWAWVDGRSR